MADGPKIIEFRSSDSGGDGSSGTSLVPFGGSGLTAQQQEEVKQFGALLDRQADEYARYYGQFFDEFINFFTAAANKAKEAEDDIIEGVFAVGGGDGGGGGGNNDPPYDDPFSFMDDGRFIPDDVRNWLNELEEEYKTQVELLERSNQAYDELTEQADKLGESQEDFALDLSMLDSVVELTTYAFLSLITASFAYMKVVNELVEAVGGFSADVVQASVRSRLQEIEDRMQLAAQTGSTIADLEMTRSDLASEFRQLMREAIELAGPTINTVAQGMTEGVRWIRKTVEQNNENLELQKRVELLQASIKAATEGDLHELFRIRKLMENANRPAADQLNASLDALFDPDNIWDDDDDGAMDMPGGDPRDRGATPKGFFSNGRGF